MKGKKLTLIIKILAILAICLVSFVGIYTKEANRYENKVKEYKLGTDLEGYRELVFEVSQATQVKDSDGKIVGNTDNYDDSTIEQNSYTKTETKVNTDEALNVENYKTTKSIIEERLEGFGVENYNLSLDEETGKMHLLIPENDDTDHVVSNILQVANFEIKDSKDNSKVFIKNSDIQKVSAVYNTTQSGTTVYLDIKLNKEGTKTLKEISTNEYKTIEESKDQTTSSNEASDENSVTTQIEVEGETTSEDQTSEDENQEISEEAETQNQEAEQKEIILAIDNNDMITTSFDTPIEDGVIDLSMGSSSTDSDKISETLKSTSTIAILLNSGNFPLTYKVTQNQYVKTDITDANLKNIIYASVVIWAILLIVMCIKFKAKGILGAICNIGFIALYLLVIRYTNVAISLESMVGIGVIAILNYWISLELLKINEPDEELKKKEISNEYKSFISKVIPALLISIVFCFITWEKIATFGMVMFWGIVLILIYNIIVTKKIID